MPVLLSAIGAASAVFSLGDRLGLFGQDKPDIWALVDLDFDAKKNGFGRVGLLYKPTNEIILEERIEVINEVQKFKNPTKFFNDKASKQIFYESIFPKQAARVARANNGIYSTELFLNYNGMNWGSITDALNKGTQIANQAGSVLDAAKSFSGRIGSIFGGTKTSSVSPVMAYQGTPTASGTTDWTKYLLYAAGILAAIFVLPKLFKAFK